jgi:hypothetical protein
MIALLTSNSRESVNKAKELTNACLELKIKCHTYYDTNFNKNDYELIIPCSDRFGDNGHLVSKSQSYHLISKCGFDILPYYLIDNIKDLDGCKIQGEIFVKPDASSAVHSVHSWGYQKFNSVKDFKTYLIDNNYVNEFNSSYIKYIVMPFIQHDGVYTFSVIQRKDCVSTFAKMYMAISDGGFFYDYAYYQDYEINLSPCNNFWKNGLRNNLIYIQTIKHNNKFYPIDINCRLSTYLDTLATHYDKTFYKNIILFLLKKINSLNINLPSKHTLIGRVKSNPFKQITNLKWNNIEGVDTLNFNKLSMPNASYDKAYSWLTYVVRGETNQETFDKKDLFLSNISFNQ